MQKRHKYSIVITAIVLLLVAAGLLRTCAVDGSQVADSHEFVGGGYTR